MEHFLGSNRFDDDPAAFCRRDAHACAGLDEIALTDDIEADAIEFSDSCRTQCGGRFTFTSDKHLHVFAGNKALVIAFHSVEHHFAPGKASLGCTAKSNGDGDGNDADDNESKHQGTG